MVITATVSTDGHNVQSFVDCPITLSRTTLIFTDLQGAITEYTHVITGTT